MYYEYMDLHDPVLDGPSKASETEVKQTIAQIASNKLRFMLLMVSIIIVLFPLTTPVYWLASATVPLQFTVLDAETGLPVSGASIQLLRVIDREYLAPPTGPDGRTTFVIQATSSGYGSVLQRIFSRKRPVNYRLWVIDVEAKGYAKFKGGLEKLTSDRRFHEKDVVSPPIVIQLQNQGTKL